MQAISEPKNSWLGGDLEAQVQPDPAAPNTMFGLAPDEEQEEDDEAEVIREGRERPVYTLPDNQSLRGTARPQEEQEAREAVPQQNDMLVDSTPPLNQPEVINQLLGLTICNFRKPNRRP